MRALTLTESELVELTGYVRPADQEAWLKEARIPCRRRRDGTVSVVRAWAEYAPFANRGATVVEPVASSGPKMEMIGVGRKRG